MSTRGNGPAGPPLPSFDAVAAELVRGIAPVIVSHLDATGRTVHIEGALLERLGYSEDWFLGKAIRDVSDDETAVALVERVLAGEEGRAEVVLNGRPWLAVTRPVRTGDGTVVGAVSVMALAEDSVAQQELLAKEQLNRQFEAVIELSQDFIAIVGLDRGLTYLNRAGRAMVGIGEHDDVVGLCADELLPPTAVQRTRDEEAQFLEQGRWEGPSSLRHVGTGEVIPVSAQTFMVSKSLDGRPLALASVRRDVREQRAAENAMTIRIQEQRSLALLGRQAMVQPLSQLMDEAVQLVAARYHSLTAGLLRLSADGRTTQMVATSRPEWLDMRIEVKADSVAGLSLATNTPISTEDVVEDPRFPLDGPTARLSIRSALWCPIPGADGPWGMVGVSGLEPRRWTDDDRAFVETVASILGAAVQRNDLETQLQHQALHDPLTGLPNRALVLDRIESALGRSARQGRPLAVLLLDVDDFKSVNDALGHGTGDQLLAELALRLGAAVREGDTVARLGGDEFVVLCEGLASEEEAAFVATAVLDACSQDVDLGGRRLTLSASVGVAMAVEGRSDTSALLGEADIAMYRAKRDRPGTFRIFDEAMRGDVLGRINVAGELRAAVREERIDLAFQPIVHLTSGCVVALEALARWRDDRGEAVSPDLFIPVAEETGLIGELGALVLRDSVRAATAWQDVGAGEIGVRVNASAHELRSHTYVDQVNRVIAAEGLPARLLGIEITESALVDEDPVTQENLTRLRRSGVRLLIDDFGTGYSSLSYLQRFPVVDVLKVDRSFLGAGTRGEAVVQAVVGLGRAFGLQVCAEGVETAEQHARVAELGCDFAQGYLLSRPVRGDAVHDLLTGWLPVVPEPQRA